MKKNRLTKVQRQARSQRRTATKAELFANKIKNALRLAPKKSLMNKFVEEAKEEIALENSGDSDKFVLEPMQIVADKETPSIIVKGRSAGATTMHAAETKYLLDKIENGIKDNEKESVHQ
jgi:ubiquinone biosynthesis protein COQ9